MRLRARKTKNVALDLPPIRIEGPHEGKVLVLSWGSVYGASATAVHDLQERGASVSNVSLRYLNPLPADLGDILNRFEKVLIPELNLGQLRFLIRGRYMVEAEGLNKVSGKPFTVAEIVDRIEELL